MNKKVIFRSVQEALLEVILDELRARGHSVAIGPEEIKALTSDELLKIQEMASQVLRKPSRFAS